MYLNQLKSTERDWRLSVNMKTVSDGMIFHIHCDHYKADSDFQKLKPSLLFHNVYFKDMPPLRIMKIIARPQWL
jgi:hypothetical protein